MKILFTADHHIKLSAKNVSKSWSLNRLQLFFSEIESLNCDLHILGGDLFDKTPSLDELEVFLNFVSSTKHQTLYYDGNHEAGKKGETFLSKLTSVVSKLNPRFHIINYSCEWVLFDNPLYPETSKLAKFNILPYCDLHKAQEILSQMDKSLPLFTHVRGSIEPHVKPEVDLSLFEDFPVVFAGDLHSHKNTQLNIVYPGSPMTTSFHRNKTKGDNGYLIIDSDDWSWTWHELNLPQLIRKTITDPSEAVPTSPDLTIYELEGSIKELSQVNTNSLISSKKLTTNKDETTSILSKDLDIKEEFYLYAKEVLKIEDPREPMEILIAIIKDLKVE